jgi:hypothetical protein
VVDVVVAVGPVHGVVVVAFVLDVVVVGIGVVDVVGIVDVVVAVDALLDKVGVVDLSRVVDDEEEALFVVDTVLEVQYDELHDPPLGHQFVD